MLFPTVTFAVFFATFFLTFLGGGALTTCRACACTAPEMPFLSMNCSTSVKRPTFRPAVSSLTVTFWFRLGLGVALPLSP